jgi:hypothetical protein
MTLLLLFACSTPADTADTPGNADTGDTDTGGDTDSGDDGHGGGGGGGSSMGPTGAVLTPGIDSDPAGYDDPDRPADAGFGGRGDWGTDGAIVVRPD